jgi:hypothetical protein
VLSATITALTNRIDAQFFIAYWLPAFFGVLGSLGLLAARIGSDQLGATIETLDSVQQSLALLIGALVTTMLAFVLRALTLPIAEIFAGVTVPGFVADRLTRTQIRARNKAARSVDSSPGQVKALPASSHRASAPVMYYPQAEGEMQPTVFGNILAAAADHPRLVYSMDGAVWWPRLMPLLPAEFKKTLGEAQAPMIALLNMSVVFAALALVGSGILALGSTLWSDAVILLVGGLILSRLCYLAAVSQVAQVARLMQVAFDLYRHAILKQMDLTLPSNLKAERGLWNQLTHQVLAGSAADGEASTDQE